MLVQMHFLQNYAPANLNRDDTNAPKDAVFGNVRRGRVSSQCLKRSIRRSSIFRDAFGDDGLLGMRTKLLPELVRKALKQQGADDATVEAIVRRVPEIGRESTKRAAREEGDENETTSRETESATRQLIFIGHDEIPRLADKLWQLYQSYGAGKWPKVKIDEITKALGPSLPRSVDIAMFGRMTTSSAFEDVQAAVQVAHAISTHALVQESDYYTAVDDLSGESGAGMIGDVEFNSSTYYRYLNVHWEQLVRNLGDDIPVARKAVLVLLEAAAKAHPSGKQNAFAAFNLPDVVLVEVMRDNLPVSYANAFLKPARPSGDQSLMDASVAQLSDYMNRVIPVYDLEAQRAYTALQDGHQLPFAQRCPTLKELREWLAGQLPE
ncbi:MAG: type I-E CRISPR-associated protein Cas7/Cse4/CasC [Ardenticatenia bacterium]|nr:MAG: type I-E CRISPR-associated protein Cas7/Cse4/CasC [Ardenticatenia bacterium]